MKTIINFLIIVTAVFALNSCTVTNNMYLNDPEPCGRGKVDLYAGIGTGMQVKLDSVYDQGYYTTSYRTTIAPSASLGTQFGVTNQCDVRVSIHFPYIIGGFGIHAGVQNSFFNAASRFNMAVGIDAGGVLSKKTIHNDDQSEDVKLNPPTKGAMNADIFMPFSYRISDNMRLILTPRYSFNILYVRSVEDPGDNRHFNLSFPVLTLGMKIHNLYFEASGQYYNNLLRPQVGIAWFIPIE